MQKGRKTRSIFPEYSFIGSALKIGLTYSDLEELSYVQVLKILSTFLDSNMPAKATQEDIDSFLR